MTSASSDNPLRQLGISPHSLRAVTKELLSDVIAGLDRIDAAAAPIHIHVAEQTKEVDDCLAWSGGKRPVEYLLDNFDAVAALVRHSRHPHDGGRDAAHGEVRA